jgi:hypothetical protein
MWQFYTLDVRGKFVAKKAAGREPWSQASTYDTPPRAGKQATAGMLSTARIPAATGTPALRKGHQQQPDLCGKSKQSGRKGSQKYGCGMWQLQQKFGGRGFC